MHLQLYSLEFVASSDKDAGFKMPCFLCSFPTCHLSSHLCGLGLVKNGGTAETEGVEGEAVGGCGG